jgi:hypothetical protein
MEYFKTDFEPAFLVLFDAFSLLCNPGSLRVLPLPFKLQSYHFVRKPTHYANVTPGTRGQYGGRRGRKREVERVKEGN